METEYSIHTGFPTPPRSKRPVGWIIATIAVAVGLVAALVFGLVEMGAVSSARADEQTAVADGKQTQKELQALQVALDDAEGELRSAADRTAELNERLSSCSRALDLGVKGDRILQDLVDNALFNEPLSEWNQLWNRYDQYGRQWAAAANACEGGSGGDFTFD